MLEKDSNGLFVCGYFNSDSQDLVEGAYDQLMTELRPHMIPLVEAFHLDGQDFTVIGNRFGDIYEMQFDVSKNAKINRDLVPAWYGKYMKPTMNMVKAKL